MKSISDCLNFIDTMILGNIEKHIGIGNLEDLREYLIGVYNEKYIEEIVSILAILSQINLIIGKFFLDNENVSKNQYCTLKKRILACIEESCTNPEVDDQKNSSIVMVKTFLKSNFSKKKKKNHIHT